MSWTREIERASWSARRKHTSVVMPDGSIVLMGGGPVPYQNDVWRLVPGEAAIPADTSTQRAPEETPGFGLMVVLAGLAAAFIVSRKH